MAAEATACERCKVGVPLFVPPAARQLLPQLPAACCVLGAHGSTSPPSAASAAVVGTMHARRAQCQWRANLSQSYNQAGSDRSDSFGIRWKDRVALYAQFSAEETLEELLTALRENSWTGPMKDDGIDALYAFANVDVWELTHRFFGRKMDLGQFERFKRVISANPYAILLSAHNRQVLSAIHVAGETYICRIRFDAPRRDSSVFTFTLSRAAFGDNNNSWMVDSIIHNEDVS